jgi:hypothetical protein
MLPLTSQVILKKNKEKEKKKEKRNNNKAYKKVERG